LWGKISNCTIGYTVTRKDVNFIFHLLPVNGKQQVVNTLGKPTKQGSVGSPEAEAAMDGDYQVTEVASH
jgi:hypothetical protein